MMSEGMVMLKSCGLLVISLVSVSAYSQINTHTSVDESEIFAQMDATVSSMWQQRDVLEASLIKTGLLEAEDHHHELHDHHNHDGVGGDDDVDDIDVLASDDVLGDKISELAESASGHHPKTAFDSKPVAGSTSDELADLSAILVTPKKADAVVIKPDTSGHLLGVRPVANAKVTSPYGYRRIFGKSQFHKGIDLAAKYGSPIYATGGGKVVYAGWMRGYGRFIEIDHQNGYKTRYAHNARLRVKVGDRVSQNQRIADLGCSGRCTGPHLHYEVKKNGKHMNPNIFLAMAPRR